MCGICKGSGRLPCYHCQATGEAFMFSYGMCPCCVCVGMKTVGCSNCRGKGILAKTGSRKN